MSGVPLHDTWADGAAYEAYMGRWSRLAARALLGWLAMPPGGRWLDVGCGTGALCQTIVTLARPVAVVGIDASARHVAHVRERIPDARTTFAVGDAHALPVASATFDAVVAGLVLNFLPQPDRAVAEMARAACPGGIVAAYVWDYAGQMQLMRHFWDAAVALDPAALARDEGRRFPICQPERLAKLFREAGLHAVETRAMDIPTVFRDFDDYWTPFLGGQAPAPGYAMSLSAERRAALRERIRAGMPFSVDGSISLIARAWAVRATR